MKKVIVLFLSCVLLLPCFGSAVFADEEALAEEILEIEVDGSLLTFDDAKPFIENDRTLVPIRTLCVALGIADENITLADGVVSIKGTADGKECTIGLTIGSALASVNGEAKELDVATQIIHNRILIPLRFVSETFGCKVLFYGANPLYGNRKLVSIQSPAFTKFSVFLPQSALNEGVGSLLKLAAVMTGVHQIVGIVGENDTPIEELETHALLALAAGEQCIILDNGFINDKKWVSMTELGMLATLDEPMEKYAPDTFTKIREDQDLQKLVCSADGSIVAFPVERDGKIERLMVSSTADVEKAVTLICGYHKITTSLEKQKKE